MLFTIWQLLICLQANGFQQNSSSPPKKDAADDGHNPRFLTTTPAALWWRLRRLCRLCPLSRLWRTFCRVNLGAHPRDRNK